MHEHSLKTASLALLGGTPVQNVEWPTWPRVSDTAMDALRAALTSGRWTTTGISGGRRSFDSQFAEAFARYLGVTHCTPVTSGTTALRVALEAAGIGYGDEVLVPDLTWVADVEAVLSVGAIPVLVDVDPATLCIDVQAAAAAITRRTKGVIVVHLNGAVADLGAFAALSNAHGLVLVEDAAQAHGSTYRGQRVGSVGTLGAFSMHNSKLLTCGEGGAVTTSSPEIARRADLLRANGRERRGDPVDSGLMEFVQGSELTGSNACLSEFQLALLCDMLPLLDQMNDVCVTNARWLEKSLETFGFTPQKSAEESTRTYSNVVFELPAQLLGRVSLQQFASAVQAECGAAVKPMYEPLHRSKLLNVHSRPAWRWISDDDILRMRLGESFPNADRSYSTFISIPHPYLRSTAEDTASIVDAVEKVVTNLEQLAATP